MANMSYCRFQNTVSDMRDCIRNIEEPIREDLQDERIARKAFIALCVEVANNHGAWKDEL